MRQYRVGGENKSLLGGGGEAGVPGGGDAAGGGGLGFRRLFTPAAAVLTTPASQTVDQVSCKFDRGEASTCSCLSYLIASHSLLHIRLESKFAFRDER